MATAAHLAQVLVSGTSTAMLAEVTTSLGGNAFQITDAAKRLLDPSVAVVVDDGGVPWAGSFTLDYFFGIVYLDGAPGGAVTFDANFLPVRQITEAFEVDASLSRSLVDSSVLGTDYSKRTAALGDVSGSMGVYDSGATTYGGDVTLNDILAGGIPKVIDLNLDQVRLRFWALFESIEPSASVDGVQTLSANFSMTSQTSATDGAEVDFGWSA